jgi:endonuclease
VDLDRAIQTTFGLERDLQAALRVNLEQLEPGLHIIDGEKERRTEAGWIDITAEDKDGVIVIIELKAGTADDKAIAQILSYMGAMASNSQKPIRGILVAGDFTPRTTFAAQMVPNLELRKYAFKFKFEAVK